MWMTHRTIRSHSHPLRDSHRFLQPLLGSTGIIVLRTLQNGKEIHHLSHFEHLSASFVLSREMPSQEKWVA